VEGERSTAQQFRGRNCLRSVELFQIRTTDPELGGTYSRRTEGGKEERVHPDSNAIASSEMRK